MDYLNENRKLLYTILFIIITLFMYQFINNSLESKQFSPTVLSSNSYSLQNDIEFVIKQGESSKDIADNLHRLNILQSKDKFAYYVQAYNVGSELKAGKYKLTSSESSLSLIYLFINGPNNVDLVTIPEGLRIEQVAELLFSNNVTTKNKWDIFLEQNIKHPLLDIVNISANNLLNGYLLPASYDIDADNSLKEIVVFMLNEFQKRLVDRYGTLSVENYNPLQLSLNEIVVLASLIERESVLQKEQAIISSVLHNRLKKDMLLQSDPTVQYAIADAQSKEQYGWWKQNLTLLDLEKESPYNTYVVKGLPKRPIANPGFAAIIAAMEPAETKYLFFVASDKCDGSHRFSETLAEHNYWVSLYEKNCL
ncbi:MAG: endolytic transglycosylase MltG [Dehalococcoidia bacterium]